MNENTADERAEPGYWSKRIDEEGIETVEGIFANDRTASGADIVAARQKAIDSYRRAEFIDRLKTPKYLIGIIGIAVLIIYFVRA